MEPKKEAWPFYVESCGIEIEENRFYGFGDAGGLAGSSKGYVNREEAIQDIVARGQAYSADDCGTKPEHLGDYPVAVLSGREFVNRLKEIGEFDED